MKTSRAILFTALILACCKQAPAVNGAAIGVAEAESVLAANSCMGNVWPGYTIKKYFTEEQGVSGDKWDNMAIPSVVNAGQNCRHPACVFGRSLNALLEILAIEVFGSRRTPPVLPDSYKIGDPFQPFAALR